MDGADLSATERSPLGLKVRSINYSKEKKNIATLNTRFDYGGTANTRQSLQIENLQHYSTSSDKNSSVRKISGFDSQAASSKYPAGLGFNSPQATAAQRRNIFVDKKGGIPPRAARVDHAVKPVIQGNTGFQGSAR